MFVWVQQQHYGERKKSDGGKMSEKERGRESLASQNRRYEIQLTDGTEIQHIQLKKQKPTSCLNIMIKV